jgi:membrane protein DedA with SNARE-associated domain
VLLASLTSEVTQAVADHSVPAVMLLMAADALLPVGGELVMLYAGVIAAGAVAGAQVHLFGVTVSEGLPAYLVLALAGTVGYLVGSLAGWWLGKAGGRPLIERHGRLLHLSPQRFAKAEVWFDRHGRAAVLLGRVTPLVRSFISIPAGVLGTPLLLYTALTAIGSAIWCFGFAAAGWAASGTWHEIDHAFHYLDYAVLVAVLVLVAWIAWRAIRPADQAAGGPGDHDGR